MSIIRIFSELDSRRFRFSVAGKVFELPHLNTMKRDIRELREELEYEQNAGEVFYMRQLFAASGNAQWINFYPDLKMRQALEIYRAWLKWSGVDMEKLLSVWETVGAYTDAVENDLSLRNISLAGYFDLPLRTQVNFIETFLNERDSFLFAAVCEFSYRWGLLPELLTQANENFITANSGKDSEPTRLPRPYDPNEIGQVKIDDEMQEKLDALLTPFPETDKDT